MPHPIIDPFSGEKYDVCSYTTALKASNATKPAGMSEQQWEKSKQKGSFGVAQGKHMAGELKNGDAFAFQTVVLDQGKYRTTRFSFSGPNQIVADIRYFTPDGTLYKKSLDALTGEEFNFLYIGEDTLKFVGPKGKFMPGPAVDPKVNSVGKLTDEDMSAMFVKTKDDFAKAKGLNIKGANPALDLEVYDSLAKFTGYTAKDVAAKIERYKASGKKLSALKKQVASGKKVVPTPPAPGSAEEAMQAFKAAVKKPNALDASAMPTIETTEKAVDDLLAKSLPQYTDEEIVKAFIKAKDNVVALFPEEGFTLYTPMTGDFQKYVFSAMKGNGTKLTTFTDVEKALAKYKASGQKLSTLKKQMIKNGELDTPGVPKAPSGKAPKAPATAKPPVGAAEEVAQKAESGYVPNGASPYQLSAADEDAIFKALSSNVYAGAPESSLYQKFAQKALEMEAEKGAPVSTLDIIRAYDKKKAVQLKLENGFFYEKKLATWSSSPQGEQIILQLKADHIAALAKAKKVEEAKKKFAELQANMPDLPADSIRFNEIATSKAQEIQDQMFAAGGRWTAKEKAALREYTGGSYSSINKALRNGTKSSSFHDTIIQAQKGMRPSTQDMLLQRGTGWQQMGVNSKEELYGLIGNEFEDAGFVSTSVGGKAAFGGAVHLEIEAPIGTLMAYVQPISKFPSEREMLLAAGTRFKVLRVTEQYDGSTVVRVRAIPGSAHLDPKIYGAGA